MTTKVITSESQSNGTAFVWPRLARFYSEMAERKLDAAMTLYDSDAEIVLPGQPSIKGLSNIQRWWEATLQEYEFRVKPNFIESLDSGDVVILRGKVQGQLVSRSNTESISIDSWFMQVYRKQPNGDFLFWRGASGPNPPITPAANPSEPTSR